MIAARSVPRKRPDDLQQLRLKLPPRAAGISGALPWSVTVENGGSLTGKSLRANLKVMTFEEATQRLDLSLRVIDSWEGMGWTTDRPGEAIRMINEEIRALTAIGLEFPIFDFQIARLMERYEILVRQVRMRLN